MPIIRIYIYIHTFNKNTNRCQTLLDIPVYIVYLKAKISQS